MVFGAGSGVRPRKKHTLRSVIGVGGKLGVKVAGLSGFTSDKTRPFSVLVPSTMGPAGAKYRGVGIRNRVPIQNNG